jgi:hypothetical protein
MKRTVTLMFSLCLGGCATVDIPVGTWTLNAPDGSTSSVEVSSLRKDEYYLRAPGRTFSGSYHYLQKNLSIVKPDNPRMSGYVWTLEHKGELKLVEEPSVPVSGVRLTAATLKKD